jgi:hypothetical protein
MFSDDSTLTFVYIPEKRWQLGKRRSMERPEHRLESQAPKGHAPKGLEGSAQGFNLVSTLGTVAQAIRPEGAADRTY